MDEKGIVYLLGCLVAGMICFATQSAQAASNESLGMGARASAMGNAYIGVCDDLSAVWYNPAGLTQLIGDQKVDQAIGVFSGSGHVKIEQPVSSPTTGASRYESTLPNSMPGFYLFFGFEISDWLYIAPIPFHNTFTAIMSFSETEGDARFSGYEMASIFINLMPTVAFKLHEKLSIGVGLDVNMFNQVKNFSKLGDGFLFSNAVDLLGDESLRSLAPLFMDGVDDGKLMLRTDRELPIGIKPINDMDINFRDFGFRVGVLWRPLDWLRIGVKYRSEMRVHLEGDISLVVNPADPLVRLTRSFKGTPLDGLIPSVEDDTERFELLAILPAQIGVGFAVQPTDWLLWSVDYTWTDWHHARKEDNVFIKGDGLGPGNIKLLRIPRNYSSVHSVRTGVEFRLFPKWYVQAGFWYDPSPVEDRYWDMTAVVNNSFIYSAGTGLRGLWNGRMDLNVFFQYLMSNQRHIDVGASETLGGTKFSSEPPIAVAPNKDFSMVIDTRVIVLGLECTLHF